MPRKDCNFSALGRDIGLTRQTVSKRFKNLLDLKLIELDQEGNCVLPNLVASTAFLLPQKTVARMISAFSDHCINIYVYLINRYYANNEQPFNFTITGLKEFCGLSAHTESNNYIVAEILNTLSELGFIEFQTHITTQQPDKIKTTYQLTKAYLT